MTQQFHPAYIPRRWKQGHEQLLYISDNSSIIHNSQKEEATQESTDRWMDKHTVGYTCDGYFSALKGRKFWHMSRGGTLRTLC